MRAAATTSAPAAGEPSSGRERLLAALLYLLMGVVLLADCWRDFDRLGSRDWSAVQGQAQAELTSVLDYGQFPAWNPWRNGGQVGFAQPQSLFLSPVTPVALVTGIVPAFKLWLLPLFVIGALGMHALAGRLGLRGAARLVPGAVFFGASMFPLYLAGGMPQWLFGMALLPWLALAHRRSAEDSRFVAAAAAAYAGLLWCGGVHHFVFFPLLFALDALVLAVQRRGLRPLLATGAWMLAGVALAAVRVVPMLDVFREYPRQLSGRGEWIPLALLPRLLFEGPPVDLMGRSDGHFLFGGSAIYWFNCGAFIGWGAGLLALVAVLRAPRRTAGLLLIALVFAWLALGSGIRPSLWDALHRVPVFGSMHAPGRLMLLVVFPLALLAGAGFGAVDETLRRLSSSWTAARARAASRVLAVVLLGAVIVPLLVVNRSIDDSAFRAPPPPGLLPPTLLAPGTPPAPFRQAAFVGGDVPPDQRTYESVLRNAGNLAARSDLPFSYAAKTEGQRGYRGEHYLLAGHGQIVAQWTPNRVRVTGELTADDRLVINQNFFPGWRAAGTAAGECEPHEGLLSLPLPAGRHDLVIEFAPASIPAGFALQGVAFAILIAWGLARRARPPERTDGGPAVTRADGLALAALAAVVVAIGVWLALRPPPRVPPAHPDWRDAAITVGEQDELQSALDTDAPGGVIRLAPGTHDGARLGRGRTLTADPIGSADVGDVVIEGLPAGETVMLLGLRFQAGAALTIERCEGTVMVQSCEWVGAGPSLAATGAAHVIVIASRLDELVAADSRVALMRCEPAPRRIEATGSLLLIGGAGSVAEAEGPGAIRLDRSRLTLSSGGEAPSLELVNGSTATLSAAGPGPAPRCDGGSRVLVAEPRLPTVRFGRNLQAGGEIDADITGIPGARGTLFVSTAPVFVELHGTAEGQFLQADLERAALVLPFELPASGHLSMPLPRVARIRAPGSGLFVQVVMEPGDDSPAKLYSLGDGSLVEPLPAP